MSLTAARNALVVSAEESRVALASLTDPATLALVFSRIVTVETTASEWIKARVSLMAMDAADSETFSRDYSTGQLRELALGVEHLARLRRELQGVVERLAIKAAG